MMRLLLATALLCFAATARADPESPIRITDAVLRLPPGGAGAAALYMSIENRGDVPDSLLGASTPAAAHTMLHETRVEKGVAKMIHADRWPIPAGGKLELAPGGRHIMLMRIDPKTKPGAKVSVVLRFERAGEIRLEVEARAFSR